MEDDTVLSSPNLKEEGEEGKKEENILIFLESLDDYLTLVDSLTSTLRKVFVGRDGWTWRVLAILWEHHASLVHILTLKYNLLQPRCKFPSQSKNLNQNYTIHCRNGDLSKNREDVREMQKCNTPQLRHRGSSQLSDFQDTRTVSGNGSSSIAVDNSIQKERSKSLAVFGALVSPKLRSAQVSFETALETVVEIAIMRSLMLSTFSQLQKEEVAQIEVQDNPEY